VEQKHRRAATTEPNVLSAAANAICWPLKAAGHGLMPARVVFCNVIAAASNMPGVGVLPAMCLRRQAKSFTRDAHAPAIAQMILPTLQLNCRLRRRSAKPSAARPPKESVASLFH
jgi:hypothetical protein